MDDRRIEWLESVARVAGVGAVGGLVARWLHAPQLPWLFVLVSGGVRTDSPHLHLCEVPGHYRTMSRDFLVYSTC